MNPADPIEVLFSCLEECFLFAAAAQPAYTMEQMIDKAIIAIQNTGLYSTAILEWNGFLAVNKTWIGLKLVEPVPCHSRPSCCLPGVQFSVMLTSLPGMRNLIANWQGNNHR